VMPGGITLRIIYSNRLSMIMIVLHFQKKKEMKALKRVVITLEHILHHLYSIRMMIMMVGLVVMPCNASILLG